MKKDIRDSEYAALAELRNCIRQFIRGSDETAKAIGLEPQQYQLLLALRAIPDQNDATIGRLAEALHLKHHSVVGMVDRLEAGGYVRRLRNIRNKREVLVVLLAHGRSVLKKVVRERIHELRESGHAFVDSISAILKNNRAASVERSDVKLPGKRKSSRPKPSAKAPDAPRRKT